MKRIIQIIFFLFISAIFVYPQSSAISQIELLLDQSKRTSDLKTAVKLAEEAKTKSGEINFTSGLINSLSMLIALHKKNNDYPEAVELVQELLLLYQNSDQQKKVAECYTTMADLYRASANYAPAINYINLSISMFKSLNDSLGLARAYNRAAAVFYEFWDYNAAYSDSTFKMVNVSIDFSSAVKFDSLTVSNLNILGAIYTKLNKYEKGLEILKRALSIALEKNFRDEAILINANISNTYYFLGDYKNAISFGLKSYEEAKKYNIAPYINMSSLFLFLTYEKIGDYKKALVYKEINTQNYESLYNIQKANKLMMLQLLFDSEQSENVRKREQKINFLQYLLAAFTIIIILSIILLLIWRNKMTTKKNKELEEKNILITYQKDLIGVQNKELNELNIAKDKFFSIIAHDLKNPFYGIMGLSQILASNEEEVSEEEKETMIKEIKELSTNTYKMLDNLLEWSRSQTGKLEFNPRQFDISNLLNENIIQLKKSADVKRISLSSYVIPGTYVFADANMINTVLRNLISNAIKFTRAEGTINIQNELNDGFVVISVADNGIGMNQKTLDQLFRLDKSASSVGTAGERGTGLGMVLCKEFIEQNGGKIWVESQLEKGSTIYFSIPLFKN